MQNESNFSVFIQEIINKTNKVRRHFPPPTFGKRKVGFQNGRDTLKESIPIEVIFVSDRVQVLAPANESPFTKE